MTLGDRINRASGLFKNGYNCSQSVVAAFVDMRGFTEEQTPRIAVSFGEGIRRMRETCEAAYDMFLFAGLEKGAVNEADREGKAASYTLVQEFAAGFKKRNGSLSRGEPLSLKRKAPVSSEPEARTKQYCAKRPCLKMVEGTVKIQAGYLEKQKKQLLN